MVNVVTDVFRSIEVTNENDEIIRIDEGNEIQFATEDGEVVKGRLTKISGKGEKTKLQIVPEDGQKEEIWSVMVMEDGSLNVIK